MLQAGVKVGAGMGQVQRRRVSVAMQPRRCSEFPGTLTDTPGSLWRSQ